MADQFHFHPDGYLEMVRAEVPDYDLLQQVVAEASSEVPADAILDLGTGSGETLRHVVEQHRAARCVGIDESDAMLAAARQVVPNADLRVARLQDELPEGPFDLVVSALAVHHLDPQEKAELFRRVAQRLTARGRFVLADVVIPDDPDDAITPLDEGYDMPSPAAELLRWLADAQLVPVIRWQHRDLAVLVADRARD